MRDYDKLFAVGNVIGLKDLTEDKIYIRGADGSVDWRYWKNNSLKAGFYQIEYIICLDEHGNVAEKLFDREKNIKPMPELKTGMFVKVQTKYDNEPKSAIVVGDRVVYQEMGWDNLEGYDSVKDDIVAIYDAPYGFDVMDDVNYSPIWEIN